MTKIGHVRVLFGLLALLCCTGLSQAAPKPNIIFVLIDDMGYADLSCYGGKPGQTAHIDSLAKEGIRFSQFYVGAPICSPSRTAFITGQTPERWRITSFLAARAENQRRGMDQWLDVAAPTLPRTLQKAGYATGHFGKWHLGGQRDVGDAPLITEYGFHESLTQFEGLGDRILPLLDAFDGEPPRKYSLGSDNLGRGNIQWMDRSKVTGAFVGRAIDFIKRAEKDKKPFYVNVWPDDVHSPFFPPKALRDGNSKAEMYQAVTKAMDEQLAELFNYVKQSPTLRSNTLIVVASDNGPEPGAGSAGPLRGTKGMLYDGGIRAPFIVWGPGLVEKTAHGTHNDKTIISALDIFPSIVQIAGVAQPEGVKFDGRDQSQVLLGSARNQRATPLFWSRPPDRPGDNGEKWPDLAIREKRWKLLLMRDGSNPQLYNLEKDPGETNNLAAKHPAVVARLSKPLLDWWAGVSRANQTAAANNRL